LLVSYIIRHKNEANSNLKKFTKEDESKINFNGEKTEKNAEDEEKEEKEEEDDEDIQNINEE
jgi:hypothetical protein